MSEATDLSYLHSKKSPRNGYLLAFVNAIITQYFVNFTKPMQNPISEFPWNVRFTKYHDKS